MYDKNGHLVSEKNVRKPIKTINIPDCKMMGQIVDLFIFKQIANDEAQYNMYIILERGILYYPAIEKSQQQQPQVKMNHD